MSNEGISDGGMNGASKTMARMPRSSQQYDGRDDSGQLDGWNAMKMMVG